MRLEKMQGITVNPPELNARKSEKLAHAQWKNQMYLQMLGRDIGVKIPAHAEGGASKTVDLWGRLTAAHKRGFKPLEAFLQRHGDDGAILGSLFTDVLSYDALISRLATLRQLIAGLDGTADFDGKAESRNMLAAMSVRLKSMLPTLLRQEGAARTLR